MKLSSVIAGAAFFTTSFGAPTAVNNVLEARVGTPPPPPPPPAPAQPPPSEAEVQQHLDTPGRSTCLFYARVGSEDDIIKQRNARSYLSGYKILKEHWTDGGVWKEAAKARMLPKSQAGGKNKGRQFFELASRVFARSCSGVVYVLLPSGTSGTEWETDTVWNLEEWPNTLPPAVTAVVRLKMDDPNSKETIRGSLKRSVAPIEARDVDLDLDLDGFSDLVEAE